MSNYLESDTLRRQANTVVRLTVVTVFGLIGTVVTGAFGMNLFDFAGESLPMQVVLPATMGVLVSRCCFLYTLAKSKRLADFLDSVSDERMPFTAKWPAHRLRGVEEGDRWCGQARRCVHRSRLDRSDRALAGMTPAAEGGLFSGGSGNFRQIQGKLDCAERLPIDAVQLRLSWPLFAHRCARCRRTVVCPWGCGLCFDVVLAC